MNYKEKITSKSANIVLGINNISENKTILRDNNRRKRGQRN